MALSVQQLRPCAGKRNLETSRWWAVLMVATVAAALIAVACTNDDDDFAIGRDTATAWLLSSTPFSEEGEEELAMLVDIFDWQYTTPFEHTFVTGPIDGPEWNTRGYDNPAEGGGGISISALDNTWGYSADGFEADQMCFECTPLPFDEVEAVTKSMVVFERLGLDVDKLAIESSPQEDEQGRLTDVLVVANLLVDDVRTDVKWTVSHRGQSGLLARATGEFVTVSELGEIPILTPAEALEIAGREATPEAIAEAELTLETRFDRDSGQRLLIPVYSVPVSDNLDVDVTIAATRQQDIPESS